MRRLLLYNHRHSKIAAILATGILNIMPHTCSDAIFYTSIGYSQFPIHSLITTAQLVRNMVMSKICNKFHMCYNALVKVFCIIDTISDLENADSGGENGDTWNRT